MIWADRVALVFALLCFVIVLLNVDPERAFSVSLILVGLLWFLLRAIDFIFVGEVRRLHRQR